MMKSYVIPSIIFVLLVLLVGNASATCTSGTCTTTTCPASCVYIPFSITKTANGCTASASYCNCNGKYYFKNTSTGKTTGCYWSFWKCAGSTCKKIASTYACNPSAIIPKGSYIVCLSVKCGACNCWIGPAETRITV
jgi:hypothetical protein